MSLGRLRRYRIGEIIGRELTVLGVIAEIRGRHPIYLCWSHRSWCPMAVKIFRSAARAEREFEVLQAVAHPNILRAYGVLPPHFMTMEVLEGRTLQMELDRAKAGYLGIADSLRTLIHIGGALQHIHQAGYLHLDVKPSNVLMENGRPILIDFGTARRIDDERPSSAMGTPAYMSPEECLGEQVTPASDIFSYAVTAFEILTGQMPFPAGKGETDYTQVKQEPAMLRTLRPQAPQALEDLISKALRPDPRDRPALSEMILALGNLIKSGPLMWPPDFSPRPLSALKRPRS